jgi:hypothetical protein
MSPARFFIWKYEPTRSASFAPFHTLPKKSPMPWTSLSGGALPITTESFP